MLYTSYAYKSQSLLCMIWIISFVPFVLLSILLLTTLLQSLSLSWFVLSFSLSSPIYTSFFSLHFFSSVSSLFLPFFASLPTLRIRTQAGAEVFFERHVTHVYRRGACWEVCRKDGEPEHFDAVVLTMPVPQILQLKGDVGSCEYKTMCPPTHNDKHKYTLIDT